MSLKRRTKAIDVFSMASMTDIIFLLLIFFMISSTMVLPNAVKVNLPQAKQKMATRPTVRLTIDKALNYYIGIGKQREKRVAFEEITPYLLSEQATVADMVVVLYADEAIPYREIVKVLRLAGDNNFKMVLAARPK